MAQKLFAFWKYDQYPYCLGAETAGIEMCRPLRINNLEGFIVKEAKPEEIFKVIEI